MAKGDMHIINGVRYKETDAIREGLLTDDGTKKREPTRNKARTAASNKAPVTTKTVKGTDDGDTADS